MTLDLFNKYITTVAAFLGMGFGVYNFYIARSNRKVRLNIVPKSILHKFYDKQTGQEGFVCSMNEFSEVHDNFLIEIINMSSFPVTVDNFGFSIKAKPGNLTVYKPILNDGGAWPRKLEPREAVSLHCPLHYLLNAQDADKIKNAFAETTCGTTCTGTSKALKGLIKFIRNETK